MSSNSDDAAAAAEPLEEFKNVGKCPFGYGSKPKPKPKEEEEKSQKKKAVHYHGYLGLDKVLNAQNLRSVEVTGKPAHDEMLFIVIHQTYELWFKQIIWELDSILAMFSNNHLQHEGDICFAVQRLKRVVEIQKVLIDQLQILETMTPLSFLDFRQYLGTSSGFQSCQFRLFEIKLGLRKDRRMKYAGKEYDSQLMEPQKSIVQQAEQETSLFEAIDAWLARLPMLKYKGFDFWEEYKKKVRAMLASDRAVIHADENASAEEKEERIASVDGTARNFDILFDEQKYEALRTAGKKRLSYKAAHAALMITAYQEEPLFHMPHSILSLLLDMDENIRTWRYKHSLMVHRMLGMQLGTGGSSGYHYLKATASHHLVFNDFFDLSMFLAPRSWLPKIPQEIKSHFGYYHDSICGTNESSTSPPSASQPATCPHAAADP